MERAPELTSLSLFKLCSMKDELVILYPMKLSAVASELKSMIGGRRSIYAHQSEFNIGILCDHR